jgi:two-component system response regulator NreC
MTAATPIRIVLADDHQVLREGLRSLLESEEDIKVVGEVSSGEEAIRVVARTQPDIVVMDLGMPGMGGLEAIREIRRDHVQVRVIVLSMHSGREFVVQALQAGSDGYVPKSSAHTDLLQAIRVVHGGGRFVHPTAASALAEQLLQEKQTSKLLINLSGREAEVLRWTALGFTSREIGERLSLSPKTVDTYRERVMEKLELKNRSELVRFALQAGLLESMGEEKTKKS